ncbi:MAG: hypothetical protein M0Z99_21890, partial [Betaproteobacteria bacterium]|nr:hypothetical protein [Betaproteobacteria bacterium]
MKRSPATDEKSALLYAVVYNIVKRAGTPGRGKLFPGRLNLFSARPLDQVWCPISGRPKMVIVMNTDS